LLANSAPDTCAIEDSTVVLMASCHNIRRIRLNLWSSYRQGGIAMENNVITNALLVIIAACLIYQCIKFGGKVG
jgi:hypothetical protein